MSDSDMDIDDDVVPVQVQHTIAGDSGLLLAKPLEASVSQNGGQRVFPFTNEKPSLGNIGRGSLQNGGAVFRENRPVFANSISSSFPVRSSFVQEHGSSSITSYRQTDVGSSGPAWTGSLFSSAPMNQYDASNLGSFENRSDINGSGSLPMVQAVSVSSVQDHRTSNKKKVSSNDWEPSEPFRPSFTIPPYILPSSDALYDHFPDLEIPQDRSLTAPSSSKGRDAQTRARQQKDGDSSSGPQSQDCNNDDKNSSCSQTQYQETVTRKNMEAVEGVATSVVDQNDETTPSKEVSSSAAAENRAVVLKRSRPSGHGSWRRSDGSSHQKLLKSDERDGEVRSDAGTKAMRQFRTAVVETIKDMVKPLWREGRLTKEVHNMVVKRASEKIVSAAVQSHQVPTDSASVDQYLSMSATKIVKLVEGYVEKYGKPKP
ncbi:Protein FRIGIDA-ESSENTIAL 1 [Raphanus sativus]|uniref:Protein FRIGIDA-ESSENTIAL 1 n=1 Tax=Raphanus sativus TaxID=3726 RepID=A0A6J0MS76_RAPSA|nr:protein FRIGIDA-ESSENTIAL 1 [Raphanus sativus]KAJ4907129.1 Protein FRIGIDA-ESSENTIAL 1 [Raphanus sativus]